MTLETHNFFFLLQVQLYRFFLGLPSGVFLWKRAVARHTLQPKTYPTSERTQAPCLTRLALSIYYIFLKKAP